MSIMISKKKLQFVYCLFLLMGFSNCTIKSTDDSSPIKDNTTITSHEDSLRFQACRSFDSLPNSLKNAIVGFVKFIEYKDYVSWEEGQSVNYSRVYSIYISTSDVSIYQSYFYVHKNKDPNTRYIGYAQYKNLLLAFYKVSQQNLINEDILINEFSSQFPDENSKIAKSYLSCIWDICFVEYKIVNKDSLVEVCKNPMR